jgi:hypothetical protein
MIFPAEFEEKTGFSVLRQQMLNYCLCPLGQEKVNHITFETSPETISTLLLGQSMEMKRILENIPHFPQQYYDDLFLNWIAQAGWHLSRSGNIDALGQFVRNHYRNKEFLRHRRKSNSVPSTGCLCKSNTGYNIICRHWYTALLTMPGR